MSMRVRLVSINEMLCALTPKGDKAMVNRDTSSLCVSKIIVGVVLPLQSYKELLTLAKWCVAYLSCLLQNNL